MLLLIVTGCYAAVTGGDFQLGYLATSSEPGTFNNRLSMSRDGYSFSFGSTFSLGVPQPLERDIQRDIWRDIA